MQQHLATHTADADFRPGVWLWSLNPSWFSTFTIRWKLQPCTLPPGSVTQRVRPCRWVPYSHQGHSKCHPFAWASLSSVMPPTHGPKWTAAVGKLGWGMETHFSSVLKKKSWKERECLHSKTWDQDGPTNPIQAGATLPHLALIKNVKGQELGKEREGPLLILQPVLHVQPKEGKPSFHHSWNHILLIITI